MRGTYRRKALATWLKDNYHLATLALILAAVIAWDYTSLHPRFELDLSGRQWEASSCSLDGHTCGPWARVKVPGHFLRAFDQGMSWQRIRFRRYFTTPPACRTQTCKLVFAEVGDSLDATLNDVEIRRVQEETSLKPYEKNFAIGLDLPRPLLHQDNRQNLLVVDVRSLKRDQTGIRTAPVGIVTQLDGQRFIHGKTFRSLYLPLVGAVVVSLCILLLGTLTNADFVPFRRTLNLYAVVSALFMVSFSELPRSFLPIEISVPLHFFLRFAADAALLLVLCKTSQYSRLFSWVQKIYIAALILLSGLLTSGIVVRAGLIEFDVASATYDAVRFLNPSCASSFFVVACIACWRRHWGQGVLGFAIWAAVMHDYMVGSGYLQSEFLSKYHHACIVLGYALYVAGQAGRHREAERTELAAERKISSLAQQVAHDVESPLGAMRVVLRLNDGMPQDLRALMTDSTQRIDDIIKTMRVDASNFKVGKNESKADLHAVLTAGLQETKLKHLRRVVAWHEDLSSVRGCFVRVDVGEFRRVLSNLFNNAIEAIGDAKEGHVKVAARPMGAGRLSIVIADNGPGIPESILANLGTRGMTVGKENGSGLGLSHAWQSMRRWGGELKCRKPDHGGTEVTLDLPEAAA